MPATCAPTPARRYALPCRHSRTVEQTERYFGAGKPWHLLSVSDAIDTRAAGGMLVLNVLMSVAQLEREAIGEGTREGLRHLKQTGVKLGGALYGWRYSETTDEHGSG